jgi:oligopeptide transport system substrate-binding protein
MLGVSVKDAPAEVREALRRRVQGLCPERFDEVYPYLGRLLSLPLEEEFAARMGDLDGKQLKEGTFEAVETLLGCAAGQGPLVLVAEDLHWADPSSVELLESLLPLTGRVPLLLICVLRPERAHACWRLRETIAQDYHQRHVDLVLEPLSAAESASLVGNLLRIEDLPGQLKARILEHAEGNPFYLEEVLRSLIDEGIIEPDEAMERWTATQDVADIEIPDTLQGVLMARIDRLQEETRRVLQMAAVIGRIFLYRVLAAIAAAVAERDVDGQLLTLQQEEMIRERARLPEMEYIFKHHLTQEAAYNGLLKKERRVFHRQVAKALERLFPERVEEQLGLLAYHWERARDADKAIEYLLRAGDQARLAYAHKEAVDYYRRALALLKEGGDPARAARTLMQIGLTYHNAFDFLRSREAYEEGFALWKQAAEAVPAVPPTPAPHPLRMVWYGLGVLDPGLEGTIGGGWIIDQLFSGLVAENPRLDIVPDVAQSWEVSHGGKRYVFHLRDDVRWSDGTFVTAGDFAYAWRRMLEPAAGSPNASLLYDVVGARAYHEGAATDPGQLGIRALNDVTLEVELEEPTGHFLQLLACSETSPVPRHVVEVHGELWTEPGKFVTNGPFLLAARPADDRMLLVRNPSYHGRFTGNLEQVELCLFLPHPSPLSLLEDYQDDELDIFYPWELPLLDLARTRQQHAGEFVSEPWLHTSYLSFDTSCPPFDDRRVRRAFALATDRETLVSVALEGLQIPAMGGFVPPGMAGHSPGIALPHDPQAARELFAEAGYPGGRGFPPVLYLAQPMAVYRATSHYLSRAWQRELGVKVNEEAVDWPEFADRVSTEPPHLYAWGWVADYPDPDSFLRVRFERDTSGWQNAAYQELVEKARRLTDQRQRMSLYGQADEILVEDAAVVPLGYALSNILIKPWVRRFPTSPRGGWFLKDVILEEH